MKKNNLAWLVLASASIAFSGMGMAACSSSSGGNPTGGDDSSGDDGGPDGTTKNDGSPGGDSGPGSDGGGVDCGKTPMVPTNDPGDIFCGFGDDGGFFSCETGMQCCLGGSIGGGNFDPEQCATWGTECPNPVDGGVPIECQQPSDCASNGHAGACCLQGATAPAIVSGCTYDKSTRGSAIACVDSDAAVPTCPGAGDIQICSTNAECPSGKTCTAMKWKIYNLGFCQ